MCRVQTLVSSIKLSAIAAVRYGIEEDLSFSPAPLSLWLRLYWRSTGNGSAPIISMRASRSNLPERWVPTHQALSSDPRRACGCVSEAHDILSVLSLAREARTSSGAQLQGSNGYGD